MPRLRTPYHPPEPWKNGDFSWCCRFGAPDPAAQAMPSWSPYHMAYDNPALFSDPTGAQPEIVQVPYATDNEYGMEDYYYLPWTPTGRFAPGSGGYWSDPIWDKIREDEAARLTDSDLEAIAQALGLDKLEPDGTWYISINRAYHSNKGNIAGYIYRDTGRFGINVDVRSAQNGGSDGSGSWFQDHHYFEISASGSYGAQASIIPTPEGIMPYPFIKGGYGMYVNIGSLVLGEFKANNKTGTSDYLIFQDHTQATQGLGITFLIGGGSIEYRRNLFQGGGSENIINISLFLGLLSMEYNFDTAELDVGMIIGAKWALGGGIEGKMKNVLKFNFNE